jgi:hypothetical protein
MVSAADDNTLEAIINWIPIEAIASYQFVIGFVPPAKLGAQIFLTILFTVLTPLWIGFATKGNGESIAWRQLIVACVAFIFWILGTQEDIVKYIIPAWEVWMGSVSIGLGAFCLPILDGILCRLGIKQS